MMVRRLSQFVTTILLLGGMAAVINAEEFVPEKSAEQTVQESIEQGLAILRKYQNAESDEQYLKEMAEVLTPTVGFQIIAFRVMGEYYNQATIDQKRRFLEVFTNSMINTYAGGLKSFGGYRVEMLPGKSAEEDDFKNTRVYLEVIAPDGNRFPMIQSMYYSRRSNGWLMQNVIFNGVNLGITFRNQFDQVVQESNGDLDRAIERWAEITQENYEEADYRDIRD